MNLRVGCCGFPVSQAAYFLKFSTVELGDPFYNLPRLETARAWRERSPEDFEFSLKAWQLITHPASSDSYRRLRGAALKNPGRYGHFQDTEEVRRAWARVQELARALSARFVLFQTPATFYPSADHLRNFYRFFKNADRGRSAFVWEPRGEWEDRVVQKVCADLSLLRVGDPLRGELRARATAYLRLSGRWEGRRVVYDHSFGQEELRNALQRCPERAYVYFNNRAMWQDAGSFQELSMRSL